MMMMAIVIVVQLLMDNLYVRLMFDLGKENKIDHHSSKEYLKNILILVQQAELFPQVIQIYTKFVNFTSLYFSYFTTFPTKLCHFTNFEMLFPAVVSFFLPRSNFSLTCKFSIGCKLPLTLRFSFFSLQFSIIFRQC